MPGGAQSIVVYNDDIVGAQFGNEGLFHIGLEGAALCGIGGLLYRASSRCVRSSRAEKRSEYGQRDAAVL
jgi:hypothetical protein